MRPGAAQPGPPPDLRAGGFGDVGARIPVVSRAGVVGGQGCEIRHFARFEAESRATDNGIVVVCP
jgi:hypothetical protein